MFASAGLAAMSAIQQGKAAEAASAFNAMVQKQNAEQARSEARMQAAQTERENFLRLGAIRAAQGASGGTGEGSVLDVIADTARQGELERQHKLYQGEAAARGYTNTATLDVMRGRAEKQAGQLRAGTELLSGAASGLQAMNRVR
jgi:hypothetical protein